MTAKIIAQPGTWKSKISAEYVANGSSRLADIRCKNETIYWLESVAAEQGRMTIMRFRDAKTRSILPHPFSVRSKVHEYGGAPYCIADDSLYFVNAKDQAIYRLCPQESFKPEKIYHNKTQRFGDLIWVATHKRIVAVCETHLDDHTVENSLVSISQDGELSTLTTGADFYAYPRYCSKTGQLCWISWQHPNMPWDSTHLFVAQLRADNSLDSVSTFCDNEGAESIVQPLWHPNGELFYISDRNNWWNIYQQHQPVGASEAEYATPLWVLGVQQYTIFKQQIYAAKTKNGSWSIECIDLNSNEVKELPYRFSSIESVFAGQEAIYFIASTTTDAAGVYCFNPKRESLTRLDEGASTPIKELSHPESIFIDIDNNAKVHAFYYPPYNSVYDCKSPPPLIVLCHGGPTGQTSSELNYKIQYWTNRGFAVVDINYRGSTGFGRKYRELLYGNWGIVDVEDMVSVVNDLVAKNKADAEKVIIKGSSAGGYTVLAALAFTEQFNAGVSLYGIGDLELLATDTHKFEKHYLDQLVGPYPEKTDLYKARSPINAIDQLSCPILLFQGLEDKVVPPNQAKAMALSLEQKGIPVALVEFEDEGHGFRSPTNIKYMLETELYFYQRIFHLADINQPTPIKIKNLD